MTEISCIFCDIASNDIVIRENGYMGRRCPKCGLVYISPRPSREEILALYEQDAAKITARSHMAGAVSKRMNAKHHLRIVRSFARIGELLEVGAGAGYFLDEAQKLGYAPYALELNPMQADFIRQEFNVPCEQSTIATSIFAGKKFDIVYHCDVISHFYDPISDFRNTRAIMKQDALLVFETGFVGQEKYLKFAGSFQYPDHLFFFSEASIAQLLALTGFRLARIYRYSLLPQLKVLRMVRSRIESTIEKSHNTAQTSSPALQVGKGNQGRAEGPGQERKARRRQIAGYAYRLLRHVLRYKIGAIVPKRGRPQTVIVVARAI